MNQDGEEVPFTVTARLQQGAALDARHGIALDGLLAAQVRALRKRDLGQGGEPIPGSVLDGGQHVPDPVDVALPLAICRRGQDWHWLATTAVPVDGQGNFVPVDPDVHYLHNRHDARTSEHVAARVPATVSAAYGRFRSRRLPVITFPAVALVWRAVGDPDAVRGLLAHVATVGARRSTGEGTVLAWEVQEHPTGDRDSYGHLHADATLGRPSPRVCADAVGAHGVGVGLAGLRPPYWHQARQHLLVLPGYPQGGGHAAS